jgi:hypothetical protein
MEIDKAGIGSDESIVLFPRSYNKRGDERLHSVQGVTFDGREVNIKLRVDESMQGKDTTPSIAEFAREDVKGKNPCLASPDNAPDNREGVLLFTGCEEDGENKKGIQSYTARWAYVLASHSDSPEPIFGLGRVVMIAESVAAKSIHQELTDLEQKKPEGWEAIAERKRRELNDPMLFSYYGQLYQKEEEKRLPLTDRQAVIDFANEIFQKYTKGGVVGGLLIRTIGDDESSLGGFSSEIFPRWKRNNTYQTAEDVLGFFFQANASRLRKENCESLMLMPIMRYSCGPSFKNYYFLKRPDESLLKLRKRFLINNEPTVGQIAFALSRREDTGESFMMKYYPLSNPLSSVADIGKAQVIQVVEVSASTPDRFNHQLRPVVGLGTHHELFFPSWHRPVLLGLNEGTSLDLVSHEDDLADLQELESGQASVPEVVHEDERALAEPGSLPEAPPAAAEPLKSEVDDGDDLSDMFADFTEQELDEIAQAEKIALEASRLLEIQAQAALDAQEALSSESLEEDAGESPAQEPGALESPHAITEPGPASTAASDLALTDLSTDSLSFETAAPKSDEEAKAVGEPEPLSAPSPSPSPAIAPVGEPEPVVVDADNAPQVVPEPTNAMLGWMKNKRLL